MLMRLVRSVKTWLGASVPDDGLSLSSCVVLPVVDDVWREEDLTSLRSELAQHWIRGNGVEIGALHAPLPVAEGVQVRYIDYKSQEENRLRYPELAEQAIVTTDIVDDGFLLASLADASQDFLIANHALEHSPDPYGTLLIWRRKLKPGGVLFFSVPIAARCYDRGRPHTSLAHFHDDHRMFLTGDKAGILNHTYTHIEEFIRISDRNIREDAALPQLSAAEIDLSCARVAEQLASAIAATGSSYDELVALHVQQINRNYDVHYHAFSPTSFADLVADFCRRSACEVLELRKCGGIECVAVVRRCN